MSTQCKSADRLPPYGVPAAQPVGPVPPPGGPGPAPGQNVGPARSAASGDAAYKAKRPVAVGPVPPPGGPGKKRRGGSLGHDSEEASSPGAEQTVAVTLPELPKGWSYATVSQMGATDEQAVLTGPFGTNLGRSDFIEEGIPLLTISCLTDQGIRMDKALFVSEKKAQELQRYRLKTGDLLFSRMASVGRAGIVGPDLEDALFNYHIMRLRLDESKLLPKFFTNYVRGAKQVRDYLLAVNHGATRDGINTEQLLAMPVIVAPLPEQRRIVAEIEKQFTRLEAGVAALWRVQANLKRYRAAVLKAACEGKLVPTEAELTRQHVGRLPSAGGRANTGNAASGDAAYKAKRPVDVGPVPPPGGPMPTHGENVGPVQSAAWGHAAYNSTGFETGEALLVRILAERRHNWQGRGKYKEPGAPDTTKLGPLPEGWTWVTVEQLAAHEPNSITDGPFGSNLKTEHYTDSGPRVIRLQNIGDGVFMDEYAHISGEHFARLQKHRVFANDVVIAGLGENPPRCCTVPESLGPAIVKADCIRFKPHPSVLSRYINIVLNSEPVRRRTKGTVHGVGRPRLNLGEIRSIVLPLPPLAEQRRIVAEVERRLSVVEELEAVVAANLQRAVRLRQSILQKAFTGELA